MKKQKQIELDVDFIGGQGPLTKSEELAISEFLKAKKILQAKKKTRVKKASTRTKLTV